MRKLILTICSIIMGLVVFPVSLYAYPHGYRRHTDEIYATVRYDLAVYYDESGEDLIEYIPAFTGIRVTQIEGSWRKIEYTINGNTKTGWITEGDFYSDCLYYDGREKQVLADGSYQFTIDDPRSYEEARIHNIPAQDDYGHFSIPVALTYLNDKSYQILRTDTNKYLSSDPADPENHRCHWGYLWEASLVTIDYEKGGYIIRDKSTGFALTRDGKGALRFEYGDGIPFKALRTDGKVLDEHSLRVYAQYDADWAGDYYGRGKNEEPGANNFCTSACGIFAPMNAIYTLTGKFVDPHILADYAVEKDYRTLGNGTDSGFFRAAASRFGKEFGFKFDGEAGDVDTLRKKLNKGEVAIAHVPGHYVAIVDYNKKTKKYLLLDPHYLPKRETCPYGDWVSRSVLEGETNISPQMYYFYKARKLPQ